MKKIVALISLLGLAFAVSACGDDNEKKERFCNSDFVNGCEDGVYVKCEITGTDSRGHIVELESVSFSNVDYICDGNNLVAKDYYCKDGKLYKGATGVSVEAMCGDEDRIMFCDGDSVVSGKETCGSKGKLSCVGGELKTESCADGLVCEVYEKKDSYYAGCYPSEQLTDGCKDLDIMGACGADGALSFCTRKDASKGKTIRIDCAKEHKSCMMTDPDEWGYDCVITCKNDGGVMTSDFGDCTDDGLLNYCKVEEDGSITYDTVDCKAQGKTCSYEATPAYHQYNCL